MAGNQMSQYFIEDKIELHKKSDQQLSQQISDDLLTQLQSISQIESQHLKLEEVKQIHEHIKQLGDGNEFSEINIQLCNEFLFQIGEGKSEVEKALLEILSSIAEIGAETVHQYEENQFFLIFDQSGLINQIKQTLNNKIDNDNEQIKENYSKSTINVFQIYSLINKHKYIDEDINMKCIKILQSQIKQLILKIKDLSQQNVNEIDVNTNNEIRDGIRSLKAIQSLSEQCINSELFCQLNIHQAITPLIHLNCQQYLHCPKRITFPDSKLIYDIQGAIFRELGEIMRFNDDVKQHLLENHSILDHIIPIIIFFAQNHSDQTQISIIHNSTNSTSNSFNSCSSSQSIIEGSIFQFYQLINNNDSLFQQISSIPDLLSSIIELTKYKRQRSESLKIDIQTSRIREKSSNCLYFIWQLGFEQDKNKMINQNEFVKSQIESIGSCGGNLEESNDVIKWSLVNIDLIFLYLIYGSDLHPPLKYLELVVEQQIEEGGGIEEIEADLFLLQNIADNELVNQAHYTKARMNNIRKDPTSY